MVVVEAAVTARPAGFGCGTWSPSRGEEWWIGNGRFAPVPSPHSTHRRAGTQAPNRRVYLAGGGGVLRGGVGGGWGGKGRFAPVPSPDSTHRRAGTQAPNRRIYLAGGGVVSRGGFGVDCGDSWD